MRFEGKCAAPALALSFFLATPKKFGDDVETPRGRIYGLSRVIIFTEYCCGMQSRKTELATRASALMLKDVSASCRRQLQGLAPAVDFILQIITAVVCFCMNIWV